MEIKSVKPGHRMSSLQSICVLLYTRTLLSTPVYIPSFGPLAFLSACVCMCLLILSLVYLRQSTVCFLPVLFVRLSSWPSDHLNIVHTLSPVLLPSVSLSYCSPVNLFTHVTVHLPRISYSYLCPSLPPVRAVHF
jgi:hypothetical protein